MFANLPLVRAERLIERTERRRTSVAESLDAHDRTRRGQYFTPAPVAEFLAELLDFPATGRLVVLDPGAGTGSLSAAVAARAVRERATCELHCVAFEADESLEGPLARTLADCELTAATEDVAVTTELRREDFVAWASAAAQGSLMAERQRFGACIMNPPYRKVNADAPERRAVERLGLRVTNLYAAFMALSAALLEPGGQLSAITPRSFANGPYFRPFRAFFLERMALDRLHVYEQRGTLFADAGVLQENIVLRATRDGKRDAIGISASSGRGEAPSHRTVAYSDVVKDDDRELVVHIPVDAATAATAVRIASLPCSLADIDVQVSTGRVVDFRARDHVLHDPEPGCAPLIYPSHLGWGGIVWPRLDGSKPNVLSINDTTRDLLLPAGHYTLVKRFTTKEERRRVVSAPFGPDDGGGRAVAFENHLNVFHRGGHGIGAELSVGLAVYLNTSAVDAYVRQFSGHTQINATDLRALRYPAPSDLEAIGRAVIEAAWPTDHAAVDALAAEYVAGLATIARQPLAA